MRTLTIKHPWRTGLVISTLLSGLVFCASMVWQAGYAQWAFALVFGAVWLLISLLLVNDEFNENSGLILASVLDENVDHLLERIHQLESRFLALGEPANERKAEAGQPSTADQHEGIEEVKKAPGNVSR